MEALTTSYMFLATKLEIISPTALRGAAEGELCCSVVGSLGIRGVAHYQTSLVTDWTFAADPHLEVPAFVSRRNARTLVRFGKCIQPGRNIIRHRVYTICPSMHEENVTL